MSTATPTHIVLPYRGEFGHKIMWHVPTIHALEGEKIVCCEAGEEALYPSASQFVLVDRKPDRRRREHPHHDQDFISEFRALLQSRFSGQFRLPSNHGPRRYFIPRPLATHGITADVVVCPRVREVVSVNVV